jgi:hypothetical protein
MSGGVQLMLMIAGVHLLALGCVAVLMIPALRDGERLTRRRTDSDSDEGWGNDRGWPISPRDVPGGGLPLPDAIQAKVRLRDHRRLHERLPGRERRPAREPERAPVREPGRRPARN